MYLIFSFFELIYEVAGPRYALHCFATHVEAKSSPVRFCYCCTTVQIVADSEGETAEKFRGDINNAVRSPAVELGVVADIAVAGDDARHFGGAGGDRKSTRLNS